MDEEVYEVVEHWVVLAVRSLSQPSGAGGEDKETKDKHNRD